MFTIAQRIWKSLYPSNPKRRPARRSLTLEHLEDRCVPNAVSITVTSTGSAANATLPTAGQHRYTMDTLATAVAFADAHPQDTYTIQFQRGLAGAINLAAGAGTLHLAANMTIQGPADHSIILEGGTSAGSANNVQVFYVNFTITAVLQNLVISNGYQPTTQDDPGGGGVYNAGTLTLSGDRFIGNTANTGAGFYNAGVASVVNTVFSQGQAYAGAGLFNTGTLSMRQSTFLDNVSSASGGGAYNTTTGMMTLANVTFTGNSAADGGGLENDGALTLKNVGFVTNHADYGGAIFNDGQLRQIGQVRFVGNHATFAGDNIYEPVGG